MEAKNNEYKYKITLLEEDLNNYQEINDELKQISNEYEIAKQNYETAGFELKKSNEKCQLLQEDNDRFKDLIKQNENDIKINELQEEHINKLKVESETSMNKIRILEDEIKSLTETKIELLDKINFLQKEIDKSKIVNGEEINDLINQVEGLTRENEILKDKLAYELSNSENLEKANYTLETVCINYKDKYSNEKRVTKNLRKKLNCIENDVKILLNYDNNQENSKIEILRNHKDKITQMRSEIGRASCRERVSSPV